MQAVARTNGEIEEALRKVGKELEAIGEDGDDEALQAIFDTLRWCIGEASFDVTVGRWLSS
jgi:hypothetical protein